jgi:CHASE3 domain sensor protein
MRSVLRHLSPFVRSRRRRISFLFTIGILLSVAFILFIINHNQQSKIVINEIIETQQPIKLSNNLTKILEKPPLPQK